MTGSEAAGFVVRGATVVDGTGAPGRVADVVVSGDRIEAVGEVDRPAGQTVVDGAGMVLSPGFIDTHTHDDFAAVLYPDMGFKVQGGVTTCVCLLYTSPSPRDLSTSRMPSSA